MAKVLHFINGKEVASKSGKTFDNINPATGRVIAQVASGDAADVNAAVEAAWRAYEKTWSRIPAGQRGRMLEKLAEMLTAELPLLAKTETTDVGKPISNTTYGDIPMGIEMFHYYGGQCDKLQGRLYHSDENLIAYRVREPYGVAGLIIPWNYPFVVTCVKASAALAAGNCVVIKPSKDTPMSAHRFALICAKAGIPEGVVNVVHGPGSVVGEALAGHPKVPKISFTGSTASGRSVLRAGVEQIKSVTVELGGKMANVVFPDADIENALRGSIFTAYLNTGQICTSGSRLLLHKSLVKEFLAEMVKRVKKLAVGDPQKKETRLGPMISKEQYGKVQAYIKIADQTTKPIYVGKVPTGLPKDGLFIAPHIYYTGDPNARIAQEEIFGPVLTVIPFETEEEAVQIANNTVYGLSAAFWTKDVGRCHRMAKQLKAGIVWGNTVHVLPADMPYGGIRQSGLGAEDGLEGMHDFTTAKGVAIDTSGNVPSF